VLATSSISNDSSCRLAVIVVPGKVALVHLGCVAVQQQLATAGLHARRLSMTMAATAPGLKGRSKTAGCSLLTQPLLASNHSHPPPCCCFVGGCLQCNANPLYVRCCLHCCCCCA
jgi:hypothetical protein